MFDSRTSILRVFDLTAQLSGSETQALRMGTTKTARRRGLGPAGAGFISPFFKTQTVTLPFALFLRPAIVSVHVKIRRQELQSIRRTRYLLEAIQPVQDIVRSLLDRTSWVKTYFIYAAS